jgi:hypothetical protein
MDVLLRQRAFLSPREVRQRLEVTRRSVHARVLSDAAARVRKARPEAEEGLGLRVTRQFLDDTKFFGPQDWQRLQREIDKIGPAVDGNERLTGERGNIKFITSGELSGLSETKTGPNRTYRLIWRFDRSQGRVVLLRYVKRAKIEPESNGHSNLVPWTDAGHVENSLADRSLALELNPIIPLKRRVAVGRPFDIRSVKISD